MQVIKIANEYMQLLKLKIYNGENYDINRLKLDKKLDELRETYELKQETFVKDRRIFILLCILTFGVLYLLRKEGLEALDFIIDTIDDYLIEQTSEYEINSNNLEIDKKLLEQNRKYYNQIEKFLTLAKSMSDEEKKKFLSYNINLNK